MLKRYIIKFQLIILLISFSLVLPAFATELSTESVSLKILIDYEKFLDPDFLYTEIKIEPGLNLINVVAVDLNFPADKLALEDIDIGQSVCTITAYEKIDNSLGNYQLICGNPYPITGDAQSVARLKFKKITNGWAKISFGDETTVLAHDGQGTNLPIQTEIHQINIIK